jgi:hypothetical protein
MKSNSFQTSQFRQLLVNIRFPVIMMCITCSVNYLKGLAGNFEVATASDKAGAMVYRSEELGAD